MAKDERPKIEIKSDSRTNTDANIVQKSSTKEKKNFHIVEKIIGHEDRPTGTYYTVRWYGYGPQEDAVEPAANIPHYFQEVYWRELGDSQQGHKPRKTPSRKRCLSRNTSVIEEETTKMSILQHFDACPDYSTSRNHKQEECTEAPEDKHTPQQLRFGEVE